MDVVPHSRGGVITYKDFIRRMEEKGYIFNESPVEIREDFFFVKTFPVKKGSIGKVLELECQNNTIISICGKNHEGGCEREYSTDISCYDNEYKEPFQGLHYSTRLTKDYHVVAEIIVTKILQKPPDQNNPMYQEWAKYVNPMLNIIGSEDPCEYPMWSGVYKIFSKDFLNNSFNLYEGEKMIFYIINPDIDIVETKFKMIVDTFSKPGDTKEIFIKELKKPEDIIDVHEKLESIFGE